MSGRSLQAGSRVPSRTSASRRRLAFGYYLTGISLSTLKTIYPSLRYARNPRGSSRVNGCETQGWQ